MTGTKTGDMPDIRKHSCRDKREKKERRGAPNRYMLDPVLCCADRGCGKDYRVPNIGWAIIEMLERKIAQSSA
jgi:hypothetical protein